MILCQEDEEAPQETKACVLQQPRQGPDPDEQIMGATSGASGFFSMRH